jgi:hypothetical protein
MATESSGWANANTFFGSFLDRRDNPMQGDRFLEARRGVGALAQVSGHLRIPYAGIFAHHWLSDYP